MLLPYLLKVSLLLMILTLSYRWLIQYETFSKINRILLFLNIAAAWSLPLIPIAGWGPEKVQEAFQQTTVPAVSEVIPAISSTGTFTSSAVVHEESFALGFMEILALIYFVGIAAFTCRFLFQLGDIIRMIRKYPSEVIGGNLKIVRNPETTSPYTFFNWIICNPEKHTEKEFEHILSHEAEHALQWHSMDLLLGELQRIILWFNPFAWFHQRLVAENLEYLADQAVLKHGFNKKQYQFSLLNVVLQTKELPLTNSFAQSLLKKRIKMMNKKPSKSWTLGKYALLILLIYGSSAFVAPYRERIVDMAPVPARQIVSALLPESPTTGQQVSRDESETETSIPDSFATPDKPAPEPKVVSFDSTELKTKGILIRNDTLYWAISALTTWDDINGIRREIKDFGGEMFINTLRYDPFQTFITSLAVAVKAENVSGSDGFEEDKNEGEFKPVKGYSGFLAKGGLGIGQLPPASLGIAFQNDYRQALAIQKDNEANFLEYKIQQKISATEEVEINKRTLEAGHLKLIPQDMIGISSENLLKIGVSLKNANFYLNGLSSNYNEINTLRFEKFIKVKILEDSDKKKHILVQAKMD